MSERGSGVGSFFLGVTVGVVLGLLYAPRAGDATRAKVGRKLRDLRELAEEKADVVRDLIGAGEEEAEAGDDEDAELEPREELERRLAEARRRRRAARPARRGAEVASEENEPDA